MRTRRIITVCLVCIFATSLSAQDANISQMLTQLISLRYGTVPIVRETGGLKDTVQPYNEFDGTGTGFSFANYNGDEMLGVINYSKHIYYNHRDQWDKMVKRDMEADFSWNSSARQYEGMYDWMINW